MALNATTYKGSVNRESITETLLSLMDGDDWEDYQKQKASSSTLKRVMGIAILVLLFGATILFMVVYLSTEKRVRHMTIGDTDDGMSVLNACYIEPACTANVSMIYDPNTGFTNDTGWSNQLASADSCCDICLPGIPEKVCFTTDGTDCSIKTGEGDYDYLLFDQLWLPQFCHALDIGHDPTLTHLQGSYCLPQYAELNMLDIHGLWPNYYDGYPQCCDGGTPLTPSEVQTWSIYSDLRQYWFDPTNVTDPLGVYRNSSTDAPLSTDTAFCSTCFELNHEWLKHGSCYSSDAQTYFEAGLTLHTLLTAQSNKVSTYNGTTISTKKISELYPKTVNVICDPKDPDQTDAVGIFLSLQTCWQPKSSTYSSTSSSTSTGFSFAKSMNALAAAVGLPLFNSNFEMIDCPAAANLAFTQPCPDTILVR